MKSLSDPVKYFQLWYLKVSQTKQFLSTVENILLDNCLFYIDCKIFC